MLVVIAAIAAAVAHGWPASSDATAFTSSPAPSASTAAPPPAAPPAARSGAGGAAFGSAGGAVPEGATVFDEWVPGVANLDPALLDALRRAAAYAADDGVRFVVDSGWRSPAYQERLLDEAVAKYGSEREAARWVATPTTSAHVSGDAVDLGTDAAAWLSRHGAGYGLCQTYGNEAWHYELRPEAVDAGCPTPFADPTHDPRMQGASSPTRSGRR
jgi:hypothetical protein